MFLPMGWALNPTLVPSFVPSTSNMHERRSVNPNTLPEYSALERNPPPAYTLHELPGTPARPKEVHPRRSHYGALAGASSSSSADEYGQIHDEPDFDVEANMAAAITDHINLRNHTNHNRRDDDNDEGCRGRATTLDGCANIFLLFVIIFWPFDAFFEFTGKLCHSIATKVIFVGFPAMAIFFLWMAMFQKKGCWVIPRGGMTRLQQRRLRTARQWLMFIMVPLSVVVFREAMLWMCRDGCAYGTGDGQKCF